MKYLFCGTTGLFFQIWLPTNFIPFYFQQNPVMALIPSKIFLELREHSILKMCIYITASLLWDRLLPVYNHYPKISCL